MKGRYHLTGYFYLTLVFWWHACYELLRTGFWLTKKPILSKLCTTAMVNLSSLLHLLIYPSGSFGFAFPFSRGLASRISKRLNMPFCIPTSFVGH